MQKNILIIAGEHSGDMRGAELIREFKKISPGFSFWGIGGDRMADEGVELTEHIRDLSIIGLWEAVKNLGKIHKHLEKCRALAKERKPHAVILIDYPGFNLKIAEIMHSLGIPVIYYILPQVWAWGTWRMKAIKKFTDKIIVLFKFEQEFLKQYGINADFVGHPLTDLIPDNVAVKKISPEKITLAFLPGSRKAEVSLLLPVMLGAVELIKKERGETSIDLVLAESSSVPPELYNGILGGFPDIKLTRVKDATPSVLERSDFAFVASGTATLETALMLRPFIILYRSSFLTAFAVWLIMKLRYIGLVNIIAGKGVIPELLQDKATSADLAKTFSNIIDAPERIEKIISDLQTVKKIVGEKNSPQRAALAVRSFLSSIVRI
ncbi:MAG TPA: lipid-A-disaccharide synthase [Candidatus Omnitrophota bacterium]|nr:lipid-A-disaccharide synthase [Candidatus Omnitrophota bacterium]HPS20675.1 lipid-A-disaccharide synthase [Candidatus Omnitrophota bacterium]